VSTHAAILDGSEAAALAASAAVAAGDEDLRGRMAAALAVEGIIAVEAADLRALTSLPPDGVPWEALVLACEMGAAPARVRELRRALGDAVALVVVAPERPSAAQVRRAMRARLDGVVLEADIERALGPTVRAALTGHVVVPRPAGPQPFGGELSHREKEVLAMVVLGFANGQIAGRLFLAESTVKSHLTSAFTKLGVRSRSEAAALILDPHEPVGRAVMATRHQLRLSLPGDERRAASA
jgi:DNA-binding NarL/FixJ family response regulator